MSHAIGSVTKPTPALHTMRLSSRVAFWLQASITVALLAGSSAPTPLYALYQAAWGFSAITTTLVFGAYALAVLAALLCAGRLSGYIGRRPVLMGSTLLSAVAMAVFGTASGEASLYVGRLLQGLATGAAVAAVGAGLVDLDKAKGTVANALAPISGTAVGGLLAGLAVHFLPYPTHLVYAVFGSVFVVQALGVAFLPEGLARTPGALASLSPQFAVPPAVRGPMWRAVPVLVAAWGLAGFYASLGPALIHGVFGFDTSLYGGMALFLMMGSGAAAVLTLMQRDARTVLIAGAAGLAAGTAVVLASLALRSAALFFAGTALAGIGFGAGFQGAIRAVVPLAEPQHRAGVLSVVFAVSYLAMALPTVGAGIAMADGAGILQASQGFGLLMSVLSTIALVATLLSRRLQPASDGTSLMNAP